MTQPSARAWTGWFRLPETQLVLSVFKERQQDLFKSAASNAVGGKTELANNQLYRAYVLGEVIAEIEAKNEPQS